MSEDEFITIQTHQGQSTIRVSQIKYYNYYNSVKSREDDMLFIHLLVGDKVEVIGELSHAAYTQLQKIIKGE